MTDDPSDCCPYCLSPMEVKPLEKRMTARQWPIYVAVIQAGPDGVSNQELMEKFLPGRSEGTLRSCVYSINQIINPKRLEGRGGRYYLGRVKWSEEGICDTQQALEKRS